MREDNESIHLVLPPYYSADYNVGRTDQVGSTPHDPQWPSPREGQATRDHCHSSRDIRPDQRQAGNIRPDQQCELAQQQHAHALAEQESMHENTAVQQQSANSTPSKRLVTPPYYSADHKTSRIDHDKSATIAIEWPPAREGQATRDRGQLPRDICPDQRQATIPAPMQTPQ